MVLTGTIAYLFARSALRPLRDLGAGLTRIRRGDYATPIPVAGPPEIRQGCQEANALATTLARLSHDNRDLLHRLVSLQDNERRDLARELHDELGPLLFSIRAGTIALSEAAPPAGHLGNSVQEVMRSVEALQQTTAASSTDCGHSTSRNWGSMPACGRCSAIFARRRRISTSPQRSIRDSTGSTGR